MHVSVLPRRRTKQEQRDDSTARILQAAQELFITKGYNATTTEEIGVRAGLTKGSVYFYFGEKTAVLLALLSRVQSNVLDPLMRKLETSEGTPLERLHEFLLQQARLANEDPAMLLLPIMVSMEFADSDEEPGRRVRWGYRRTAELLARLIEEGQAAGLFRLDISPKQQASLVLALNDGAMLEWWRSEPRTTGRGVVDALYAVLTSGVCVAATPPKPAAKAAKPAKASGKDKR